MKADTLFLFFVIIAVFLLMLRCLQVFVTEKVYRSRIADHERLFYKLKGRSYTAEVIAQKILSSFYMSFFPYVPKGLEKDIDLMIRYHKASVWTSSGKKRRFFVYKGDTDFSKIYSDPDAVPVLSPKTYTNKIGKKVKLTPMESILSSLISTGIFENGDNRKTHPAPVDKVVSTISMRDGVGGWS